MAIETALALHTEIIQKLGNNAYTFTNTLSSMNKGLKWIAGKVLLPELETEKEELDVGWDDPSHVMPSNFHRKLFYCYSITQNKRIDIYDSYAQLIRQFTQIDLTGTIQGVAIRGTKLFYQKIPSSYERLQLNYYKQPTAMEGRTDQPTCLPEHLVRDLLVNYAAKDLTKDNNQKMEFNVLFDMAMSDLKEFLGPEEVPPVEMKDELNLDGYL